VPLYIAEREFALGSRGALSWITCGLVALITAALVCAGVGLARIAYANALVNRAVLTYNQTQDLQASSHYVAQSLAVYANNDYAHRIAVQLGLLSMQQLIAAGQSASAAQLQETLKDTIQHGLDAVSINGDDYQNWLFLAGLYAQLVGANIPDAYNKAHAAYQQALADNPTSPVPYLSIAQLELAQKNTDAALQHLQKAVELKPDFATAYYLMSQIYASQKNYQAALQAAAVAANYASGDPDGWYNLGVIAYTAQDYPDAITALRQSLAIQPQFANALYVLGLAYYQSGDKSGALTQFEALNNVDPNQEAVQQSIAELQAGKPLSILAPAATSSTPVAH
jgi:tetratricopeptide (TPR) repeat protein